MKQGTNPKQGGHSALQLLAIGVYLWNGRPGYGLCYPFNFSLFSLREHFLSEIFTLHWDWVSSKASLEVSTRQVGPHEEKSKGSGRALKALLSAFNTRTLADRYARRGWRRPTPLGHNRVAQEPSKLDSSHFKANQPFGSRGWFPSRVDVLSSSSSKTNAHNFTSKTARKQLLGCCCENFPKLILTADHEWLQLLLEWMPGFLLWLRLLLLLN